MDDVFDIEVTYKGQLYTYPAKLEAYGYTYRFHFLIDGQTVFFEPDEEGSFRAYREPSIVEARPLDPVLIEAIIVTLQSLRN